MGFDTVGWHVFRFVSPGHDGDEKKDQDRVYAQTEGKTVVGAICDGTSSSWNAADAAELVVAMAPDFVSPAPNVAIDRARDLLLAARAAALETKIDVSDFPEEMQPQVEAAARERLADSYQTTLLAFRATSSKDEIRVRHVRCGDSHLLAYDRDGDLRFSTATMRRLAGATEAGSKALVFEQTTRVTDVLPDQADRVVPWNAEVVMPADTLILATSDGLIDAFESPAALWDWLKVQTLDADTDGDFDGSRPTPTTAKPWRGRRHLIRVRLARLGRRDARARTQ